MNSKTRAILFMCLCLALPLAILLPGYTQFIYPAGSEFSDLTLSHYPNLLFLKQSLQKTGTIPFWSNAIFSGYPFAANPLSGVGYPFTWLLLILPQPFGYNLVTSLHLLIGGAGIYLILRKYGTGRFAALLGAVSFECMPKLLAHYTAGHISLVWAVCFTPWVVYTETRYREQAKGVWRYGSGLVLGFTALADIRWAPYAGLLFLVLRIAIFYSYTFVQSTVTKPGIRRRGAVVVSGVADLLLTGLIAAGISAVVWVPLMQYSDLSTRSLMTNSDRLIFSLPVSRFSGLIIPDISGNWEFALYAGALGLFSIFGILCNKQRQSSSKFWLWACLISLLWALGVHNPVMQLISRLPGFSLLRVPTRSLFIFGMAFCLLIGLFTDSLFKRLALPKGTRLVIFALMVLSVSLAIGVRLISDKWEAGFVWGALGMIVTAAIIFIRTSSFRLSDNLLFVFLLAVILLDFGGLAFVNRRYVSSSELFGKKQALLDWLSAQDGIFRVYSPSYSIPQLNAVQAGIELADGIDPLQLQSYEQYVSAASGVKGDRYSVSIPRFHSGNPVTDNQLAEPSALLLGLLNVRYVCAEFPINVDGLQYANRIDGTWIYENEYYRPRAWIQTSMHLDEAGTNTSGAIEEISYPNPNTIEIQESGQGGYLVLSEIAYPGWQVTVDGERAELLTIDGLLRGVHVTEGEHQVIIRFRPVPVLIGVLISINMLLATMLTAARQTRHRGAHV